MGHSRDGLTELRCAPHAVLGRGGTPTHEGWRGRLGSQKGARSFSGHPQNTGKCTKNPQRASVELTSPAWTWGPRGLPPSCVLTRAPSYLHTSGWSSLR